MHLLVADDHALFRETLVQYIVRSLPQAQVTESADLDAAMALVDEMLIRPDLALLDLQMPGMNGVTGFKAFMDKFPDVPVVLMSGVAEPEDVRNVMGMGARGYFPKTLSGKALVKAIELVLTGEKFIPVDAKTNDIMSAYRSSYDNQPRPSSPSNAYKLTPREMDVLKGLCSGMANKDIAETLGLQIVTVKLHVRGICRKLNTENRTQAALKAQQLGLVSTDGNAGK